MSDICLKKVLVFLCIFFVVISSILYLIYYVILDNKTINIDSLGFKNIFKEKVNIEKTLQKEKMIIEYKANQTIRVKMTKEKNEIVAMDINDYLRGVLASEMPAYYDIEALKAQAIVARTYTYQKISEYAEGEYADICDNFNHCQAFYTKEKIMQIWIRRGDDEKTREEYWNKINRAVVETQGKVITYKDEYIKAFFHASSPIKTESIDQIWGKQYYPYLVSVSNVESDDYINRDSNIKITFNEIEQYIKKYIDNKFVLKYSNNIYIDSYTTSGRVNEINVCGIKISAEKLRVAFGLKSTMFDMNIANQCIEFKVIGYGHGIGLSQVGSDYLAKQGETAEEIIKYYYTGVNIKNLDK